MVTCLTCDSSCDDREAVRTPLWPFPSASLAKITNFGSYFGGNFAGSWLAGWLRLQQARSSRNIAGARQSSEQLAGQAPAAESAQ